MDRLDEHISAQIEQYLMGKMPIAEAALFEKSIAADPVLKGEVEMQRNVINAIKYARKQELKAYIRNNMGTGISAGSSGVRQLYWYAAAATILLIVISVTYLKVLRPSKNQESSQALDQTTAPLANDNSKRATESKAELKPAPAKPEDNENTHESLSDELSKKYPTQAMPRNDEGRTIGDSMVKQDNALTGNYNKSLAVKKEEKAQDKANVDIERTRKSVVPSTASSSLPSAYNNNVGYNNVDAGVSRSNADFTVKNANTTNTNYKSAKKSKKAAARKADVNAESKSDDASRPFPVTGTIIKDTVMFPILISENETAGEMDNNSGTKADSTKANGKKAKLKAINDDVKPSVPNHKIIVSYVISPQQKDDYIFNGNWLYIYNEPMKNAVLYSYKGTIYMKKNMIVYELKRDSKIHRETPVSNKKIISKFML